MKFFLKEYEGFSLREDGGEMSFKAERMQKERFYVLFRNIWDEKQFLTKNGSQFLNNKQFGRQILKAERLRAATGLI